MTSSSAPPTSTAVSSGGGVIRPMSSQHVKAFSGKGHTLSSPAPPSSMLARTAPAYTASSSRPVQEEAPGERSRYVELSRRDRRGSNEQHGGTREELGGAQLDLAQRLGQAEAEQTYTSSHGHQAGRSGASSERLRALQDQELSLQNLVGINHICLVHVGVCLVHVGVCLVHVGVCLVHVVCLHLKLYTAYSPPKLI